MKIIKLTTCLNCKFFERAEGLLKRFDPEVAGGCTHPELDCVEPVYWKECGDPYFPEYCPLEEYKVGYCMSCVAKNLKDQIA